MSLRSLITLGLLAAPALAAPPAAYAATTTVTSTKTHTTTTTKTKTSTTTKTKTSTTTKTVAGPTVTVSASASAAPTVTVTASGSACPSTTATSATSITSGASSATTTTSTSVNTNPTTTLVATATATNYGLNDAAKAAGKLWFGTAADIPGTGEAADPYYVAEFNNTHDFGEATPANIMKWMNVEPEQNVFNFTGGDYFLDYVEGTDKLVRCHNLVWMSQLPNWVNYPATNWTNATLSAALVNHVTKVVEHFGDRCYSWDVVNEALSDSPAGAFQNDIFYQIIGEEYFYLAFQTAANVIKANNLNVKLYYNDYNIESAGAKATAALNLVKNLQARGIQIDGVGFESHFIAGETPSKAAQLANMQAFGALNVSVAVTELDVRLNLPPTAASEAQQVADYYSSVSACVAAENCIGVTVWDFDDTYSWVPSTFAGQGYADLFFQPGGANTPLVKKAAYDGCLQALTGAPESSL